MNKLLTTIIIILLISFPVVINAETSTISGCDYQREVELNKLASKISYDRSYNRENGMFTVTLYNVISDLYLKYNETTYVGDIDDKVTIDNIEEGTYMDVVVYSNGRSCYLSLMTVYVTIPFFNTFYGSDQCRDYENILTVCSSEFLSYRITAQILKDAIDNYNNKIYNDPAPIDKGTTTLVDTIKNFVSLWGMKILLTVVTIALSVWYYQVKVRKVKHGI